jgi:prolyl-tRNA synthetase
MKAKNLLFATQIETPTAAETISHKLMLKAGLIRQVASGIYTWLPNGLKVLQKVSEIVRKNMNEALAQEILMPMVQPSELWKESGRWSQYGKELLIFNDRHDRDFCLGPTHEEVITELCRNEIRSHKQMPLTLYQIQTKFRDEIRPRFGVMRSREFIMKDAYSFDLNEEGMNQSYMRMREAYINIFDSLGLDYRIVTADSGKIGGSNSEEFHVLADTGEDLLAFSNKSNYAINAELLTESMNDQDPSSLEGKPSPDGKGTLELKKGIEVGHIFKLGTKYSESLNLKIQYENKEIFPKMGCYGIGISRIVAAAIEQNHDDKGIIWPKKMCPYAVVIIEVNPKNNQKITKACYSIYEDLKNAGIEVLWDNRDQRPGVKFSDMELLGIPKFIIIGEQSTSKNKVEIKDRSEGNPILVTSQDAVNLIVGS